MQEKNEIYLRIGKNIKNLRSKKGLTQEKLSETISAGEKFIGHIERAERIPSLKKLIKIAEALEFDIKEFFAD